MESGLGDNIDFLGVGISPKLGDDANENKSRASNMGFNHHELFSNLDLLKHIKSKSNPLMLRWYAKED